MHGLWGEKGKWCLMFESESEFFRNIHYQLIQTILALIQKLAQ